MAGTIDVTFEGSFAAYGPVIQAEIDALIQVTGEAVRQGAADRSRVDTGAMRDGWTFQFEGDQAGSVYNDVPHTIFNEYGTSRMTAQPMLHPAIDAARPGFEAALKALIS